MRAINARKQDDRARELRPQKCRTPIAWPRLSRRPPPMPASIRAPFSRTSIFLRPTGRCGRRLCAKARVGQMTSSINWGGSPEAPHVLELGRLANENPPKPRLIDQKGRRIDRVEFHPAYHELMAISFRHGLHCRGWEDAAAGRPRRPGVHVARAAGLYMVSRGRSRAYVPDHHDPCGGCDSARSTEPCCSG